MKIGTGPADAYCKGYIDEVRISNAALY
jgi:hypothetical protein